ncbi:HAD family hydrolase [Sorangium sp. So ce1036]|uniref:HAD family hydrolase n=1 Tax=Sorangium sp. So ce1036 TaxID=3133328 RepID=UPI003F0E2D47
MIPGNFRGVAFDLDGTLLRSDHTISAEMLSLCSALVEQEILVTLVSSRPPRSVEQFARRMRLRGAWAALNGAIIYGSTGAILDRSPLPEETVERVISKYRHDARVSLNLYSGFDWIVQTVDRRVGEEAEIIGFSPTVDPGFANGRAAEKILLITDPETRDNTWLAQELSALGDSVAVARSKPNYIEITRSKIDKGHALTVIAASRGLSARAMVAAGDGENDIPMLKASGLPIAMGHGLQAVKEAAALVVGSNDDNSLTWAIGNAFGIDIGVKPGLSAGASRPLEHG